MIRARIAILLACCAACEAQSGGPAKPAQNSPASQGEDALCAEHGVLAAVCTKCNPALVAVFKSKGDFCEEHGFPESFCPICHPEKGGRPSVNVKDDGAPADGTKVRFKTKDTARMAGLKTARVVTRPSLAQLDVTARLVYDASKFAGVNARSAGVVRSVAADVGARVRRGSPLATIESADVGASESRLETARSRVRLAEANHARVAQLHGDGIAARKDVLAAENERAAAKAELSAAQSALTMIGGISGSSRYVLSAPIAGVVTKRSATVGGLVAPEDMLFEVVDISSLWAELGIPERVVGQVQVDQTVSITLEGPDERELTGTLSYVAPEIDVLTRTVKGRVALDNAEGRLRANMFARARISVGSGATALIVPRAAVQRAKDAQLVFVRLAEDTFEARRVEVGAGDDVGIEVRGRLQQGEEVVTEGSFLLKTETLKGSIGAGCCEVEEKT